MAVGILAAQGIVPPGGLEKYLIFGELSLDGRLKPTRGVLSMALASREAGLALIIPRDNAREAAVVQGVDIYPADHLAQLVEFSGRAGASGQPSLRRRPSTDSLAAGNTTWISGRSRARSR